jgi:hypothetical protein
MSTVQHGNCYQSKSIAYFMHNQKIYEAGPQGVTFEHKGERYNVAAIAHEEEIPGQKAVVVFARVMSKSVAQFYELREGHACTPKALKYEHPAIDALAQLAEAENLLAAIEGAPIEVPETVLDDTKSLTLYKDIFEREIKYQLQGHSSIIPYQFFHHCVFKQVDLDWVSEDAPPPPQFLSFLPPLLNRSELQNSPDGCVEMRSGETCLGTVAVKAFSRKDKDYHVYQELWLRVDTAAQHFILITTFYKKADQESPLLNRKYILINMANGFAYNITLMINTSHFRADDNIKELELFNQFQQAVESLTQLPCKLQPVKVTPYTSTQENQITLQRLTDIQHPLAWFKSQPLNSPVSSDKPPIQPLAGPAPSVGTTTDVPWETLTKVLLCVVACLGLTYLYRRFIQSRSQP